jgi:hypothetical protein
VPWYDVVFQVPEKSHHVAVTLLLIALALSTALMVPEVASTLRPSPPSVFLMFERVDQSVANGCPTTNLVHIISQSGFEGNVNLNVVNHPAEGMYVAFTPNSVYVPKYGENTSLVTVTVMPNSAQGRVNLTVIGISAADRTVNDTKPLFVNVLSPCVQFTNTKGTTSYTVYVTTVTTTVTTTSTLILRQDRPTSTSSTTTTTLTSTTTEQAKDTSTLAWAVSATMATIVLAVVVLRKKR